MLPYHILVMSGIAIFAFIFNRWLEAILFYTSFLSLRYKFPTTFHAKSIVVCMALTNAMFCLSIVLCPDISSYVFGGIVFAYIDTFLLWFIQSRENFRQERDCAEQMCAQLQAEIEKNTNPAEEFELACCKAKLSKRDREIARKYFLEKQTPKEIWIWLTESKEYDSIEWDSVYRLLVRIGNKLNIRK